MKIPTVRVLVGLGAVMVAASAWAGSFTLEKKVVDPKGQLLYVYRFSCQGPAQGTFTVQAASDELAKKLAEQKVKIVCEER